jgi:TonB family protein
VLSVVVDANGEPRDIRIVRPLGMGLDQKAVEAVSKWHFKPGMKDGAPVAVQATIEVNFRLLDDPPQSEGIRIALWPKTVDKAEVVTERGKEGVSDRAVSGIHNPSLEVFLPPVSLRNGASVIIAPGGGHRYLAIDHEGYRVAQLLSSRGITAMILRYRLAKEEGSQYTVEQAGDDGRRAVRVARSLAAQYGLDPARVGILGFSAGGDVAARAATNYQTASESSPDPIERFSTRPDFMILMYPGIAQTPLPVDASTPPAFISFASNDNAAIVESSTQLFLNLRKAGVPVEMHVFARGGHGFGIKPANRGLTATWTARMVDWMGESGWLKKQ